MPASIKDYYITTFKRYICSACKLCDSKLPAFCMIMYGNDKNRFFEIIKYIKVLQTQGTAGVICSFEGFCGLFCNSQRPCPKRNKKCENLGYTFSCYEAFAGQSGVAIPVKATADIYETFSGIDMRAVGKQHRLPTRDILKSIDKKKRKRINKLIRKTKAGMRSELQFYGPMGPVQTKLRKKRKPVVTTLFCNDDKEWMKKIDSYLENDETNNRQSAKNA